jgi:hypothetical protein
MDRVFDDPATPEAVRKLRRRAYTGLTLWAEQTHMEIARGGGIGTLWRSARAYARHPSPGNTVRFAKMVAGWPYHTFGS